MTMIVVVENLESVDSLQDKITISQKTYDDMVAAKSSGIGMAAGEILNVESLLYLMMLQSDGIATTELAIYTAGTTEKFVDMMNEKAKGTGRYALYQLHRIAQRQSLFHLPRPGIHHVLCGQQHLLLHADDNQRVQGTRIFHGKKQEFLLLPLSHPSGRPGKAGAEITAFQSDRNRGQNRLYR